MVKKIIFVLAFVFLLIIALAANKVFAQQSNFYRLSLTYNKNSIQLKDAIVLPGDISQVNLGGSYNLQLLSFSNALLYKTNFDIQTTIHGEDFDYATGKTTSKSLELDNVDFIINVPYFPNGKEIDIYDSKNAKILTIPVQQFAEVTPTVLPTQTFKPTKVVKGIGLPWILGGAVLFMTISALIYWKFKKKENSPSVS